jgi:hypothetical protein
MAIVQIQMVAFFVNAIMDTLEMGSPVSVRIVFVWCFFFYPFGIIKLFIFPSENINRLRI